MVEKDFSAALVDSVRRHFPGSYVWRPADKMTLGTPDVLAIRPGRVFLATEAKQLDRLLLDPMHLERPRGLLLKRPFTGPQISVMRTMIAAGAEVWGVIRVTRDAAFRVHPNDIPKEGNFTHDHLAEIGVVIRRRPDGWIYWKETP